jgi:hypothetical protein
VGPIALGCYSTTMSPFWQVAEPTKQGFSKVEERIGRK